MKRLLKSLIYELTGKFNPHPPDDPALQSLFDDWTIDQRVIEDLESPYLEDEEDEPIECLEAAAYNQEQILDELRAEGKRIATELGDWEPEDEIYEAVLALLPDDENSTQDISEICLEIQRKFIYDVFMRGFLQKVYSLRDDAALLEEDEYLQHILHVGVFSSQIVQMMAVATQVLISNAVIYKKNKAKAETETTKPEATDSVSWGWSPMVTGIN